MCKIRKIYLDSSIHCTAASKNKYKCTILCYTYYLVNIRSPIVVIIV